MGRDHRHLFHLIIAVIFIIPSVPAAGESWEPERSLIEEEAPPYLLDLSLGGNDAELFLSGLWNASSEVALGMALHPPLPETGRRVTFGRRYPGFETNFFAQTVDLTLSLWLYERYFFEATFADDSRLNSIAAGYYAAEDELVREFVVGNVPLAVSRYPYQYTGNRANRAGATPNPGSLLRLETGSTFHEFLIQLENTMERRLRISGGRIVEEAVIPPEQYLRGLSFVLPDGGVSRLTVFLQDPDGQVLGRLPGDGSLRRFRVLDDGAGEYVADLDAGTVRLGDTVPGNRTVAVYYETASGAVGQAGNGAGGIVALDPLTAAPTDQTTDFAFGTDPLYNLTETAADYEGNDFRLQLTDGRNALIIRSPGLWSPFEAADLYRLPAGADETGRYRLVRRDTLTPYESDIQLSRRPETSILRARRPGTSPRDPDYRYPWAAETPRDLHSRMYGPRSAGLSRFSNSGIYVEYGTAVGTIQLDGDVVPGSVAVRSGGVAVAGADVDYDGSTVSLPPSAGAGNVDIVYRVYGDDGTGGDIIVINGNRWTLRPDLTLSAAAGIRWNVTDDGYSTEMNQHPGQITLSSGVSWRGDNLQVEASGAAQLSQSDTTGFFRLFGGTSRDSVLAPSAETVFPPGAAEILSTRDVDYGGPDLAASAFVYPRYRDYWSTDLLGNVALGEYTSSVEADTDRANGRIGPYIARSSDTGYRGTVAVLEWDALPSDRWTGIHINRNAPEQDLRDARSILVTWRYIPDTPGAPTPEILLEMGALGEDLDGDGRLDRGRSAVDPLIEYNGADGVRRAGQDAPILQRSHSEDTNGNNVLDTETPSAVFSYVLQAYQPATTEGWQSVEISLDALDHTGAPSGAVARSRLAAVRAARIVAAAPTGQSIPSGRLLVGEIRVRRTGAVTVTEAGDNDSGSAGIVPDPLSGTEALRNRFHPVGDRFVPDGEDQRVAALSWRGGAASVAAEVSTPDLSINEYATATTYLFLDAPVSEGGPEKVALRIAPYRNAPGEKSIIAEIPATTLLDRWHELP